jgi:Fe-S cluster assembly ATP-binding protein
MLEIKNLVVQIEDKRILNGLNLTVNNGEVAAIMGPNGSGKSTLSYVVAGKEDYEVLDGEILLDGQNLLDMDPDQRAAGGRVPGVPVSAGDPRRRLHDLPQGRAQRPAQGPRRGRADHRGFHPARERAATQLQIDKEMLKRALNVGFSGGEKKRMEILQMALLQPSFCVLDETDSGLDIDALRVVSEGVNALRSPDRAFLVITHYQRLLSHIVPDSVHVMAGGRIVKSGGKELALELEANGYADYRAPAAAE